MHETYVPYIPISTHHWCTSAACLTGHKQPREFDQNLPEINNRMLDYIRTQFKFDWQSRTGQRVGWARKFWTFNALPNPASPCMLFCCCATHSSAKLITTSRASNLLTQSIPTQRHAVHTYSPMPKCWKLTLET